MIKYELLNNDTIIHQWSDEGKELLQVETRAIYGDAYDDYPCPYTYEEVDDIPKDTDEITPEELKTMIEEVL